jgi:smad nuclear-interacting protein 1
VILLICSFRFFTNIIFNLFCFTEHVCSKYLHNMVSLGARHPSISKQHAVIQFRSVLETAGKSVNRAEMWGERAQQRTVRPYLMDLESANQTILNGLPIDACRYYELKEKDSLRFGGSSREYVLILAK